MENSLKSNLGCIICECFLWNLVNQSKETSKSGRASHPQSPKTHPVSYLGERCFVSHFWTRWQVYLRKLTWTQTWLLCLSPSSLLKTQRRDILSWGCRVPQSEEAIPTPLGSATLAFLAFCTEVLVERTRHQDQQSVFLGAAVQGIFPSWKLCVAGTCLLLQQYLEPHDST